MMRTGSTAFSLIVEDAGRLERITTRHDHVKALSSVS